jgi:UDP-GlcNAc:undecaprenyl-phosphate GlcNAc-1-phosphate transferase
MPYLIALALGLALTPVARRVGQAAGLVDRPGDPLKIHREPVPVLGGVAVAAAVFAALGILGQLPGASVAIAAGVMLAGGVLDDVRSLPTAAHVGLQLAAAALLIAGPFEADALGAAALVAAVVACTNAVNLVDGQDGLAGGLAAIAAVALALLLLDAPTSERALGFALSGALSGFVVWNRPPARIFLGNGGAYAVGALLAVLAAMVVDHEGPRGVLPAILCLGVFLFDFAFTVARRARAGRLAAGDRDHSYDLLSLELGSRERATLAFWGAGALAAGAALLVDALPVAPAAVATAALAVGAGVWGRGLWSRRDDARPAPARAPRAAPITYVRSGPG